MTKQSATLFVDEIPVHGDLILAPMDGYTDWPFRSICRELGSAISYTEFVKAEDVLQRPHYINKKIQFTDAERPVFIQVYGHDPSTIHNAALLLQDHGPDGIDLNLGCPNKSIVSRGAGAGLLRTPKKIARIMKLLSSSLEVPVTAKIRLGWKDCQKQDLIARIIDNYGGALLAVHAKTKELGHSGKPDLEGLARIIPLVKIPVLGNGGVSSPYDINQMKEMTGCAGVMIGRAAIENPWIFSRKTRGEIPISEVQTVFMEHLERSLSFYGVEEGLVLFRKFAAAYLKPYELEQEIRKKILTEVDEKKFKKQVDNIFQAQAGG